MGFLAKRSSGLRRRPALFERRAEEPGIMHELIRHHTMVQLPNEIQLQDRPVTVLCCLFFLYRRPDCAKRLIA